MPQTFRRSRRLQEQRSATEEHRKSSPRKVGRGEIARGRRLGNRLRNRQAEDSDGSEWHEEETDNGEGSETTETQDGFVADMGSLVDDDAEWTESKWHGEEEPNGHHEHAAPATLTRRRAKRSRVPGSSEDEPEQNEESIGRNGRQYNADPVVLRAAKRPKMSLSVEIPLRRKYTTVAIGAGRHSPVLAMLTTDIRRTLSYLDPLGMLDELGASSRLPAKASSRRKKARQGDIAPQDNKPGMAASVTMVRTDPESFILAQTTSSKQSRPGTEYAMA